MARAYNNGWDFVKVGGTYQYCEEQWIAMITILADRSDDAWYRFFIRADKANYKPRTSHLEVGFVKDWNGIYPGMSQIFEEPRFEVDYKWEFDGVSIDEFWESHWN